jgi:dynein heavy chain
MDKLDKKRRTLYGAKPGKKIAIFVDDINMPAKETYGAQPPIELLRLFIDRKGLFKREDWSWFDIEDTTVVAAAAPPTGGRSVITPRFTTHFNMFCVPNPSGGTLGKIFGDILKGFLKNGFVEQVQQCQEGIISSTIEIYNRISNDKRATPAKFHYVFNLRDVSKVIQGILMAKPASIKGPEDMAKLWLNEVLRIFSDRLINEEDKEWFVEASMDLLGKGFRNSYERGDLFHKNSCKLLFGDILKLDAPVQLYEELTHLKPKLLKALHGYLDDYNMGNSSKMNLVLFDDAVDHILRISRVLRQPRGNIMCIGVGGSGKQSLIRLSSHMLAISFY